MTTAPSHAPPAPPARKPPFAATGLLARPSFRPIAFMAAMSAILATGVLLRLWVATFGYNYDVESWIIVADLAAGDQNVYAHTERYNYGPPWFLILELVQTINARPGFHSMDAFHLSIVLVISLADIGLTLLMARRWGWTAALIFFLCPVTVLITGYHTPADSLALLAALASWLVLVPKEDDPGPNAGLPAHQPLAARVPRPDMRRLLAAAVLMGLSLAIKHVMILFPVWVLLCPSLGRLRRRLAYAGAAYGLFLASFLPYAFAPGAFEGIRDNVFGYNGVIGTGLVIRAARAIVPFETLVSEENVLPALKVLWLCCLLVVGRALALARPGQLFLDYLVAFVLFALAMADQYLLYAVIPCAVMWRFLMARIYLFMATFALLVSPLNIRETFSNDLLRQFPFRSIDFHHVQVWLIPVLLGPLAAGQLLARLRQAIRFLRSGSAPPPDKSRANLQ